MNASLFWLSDEQWARIEPHLSTNQPGPEREDDRRILGGIMHVQRIGCRWKDCPSEYGPAKTIYNRFARWSERGIWQKMSTAVAGEPDAPGHERGPLGWWASHPPWRCDHEVHEGRMQTGWRTPNA